MLNNTTQYITLAAGETRELVFINESNMDWHIIQEANSSLRVHVLFLSESDDIAQWQSRLFVEQNAVGCRTEIYAMGLLHAIVKLCGRTSRPLPFVIFIGTGVRLISLSARVAVGRHNSTANKTNAICLIVFFSKW